MKKLRIAIFAIFSFILFFSVFYIVFVLYLILNRRSFIQRCFSQSTAFVKVFLPHQPLRARAIDKLVQQLVDRWPPRVVFTVFQRLFHIAPLRIALAHRRFPPRRHPRALQRQRFQQRLFGSRHACFVAWQRRCCPTCGARCGRGCAGATPHSAAGAANAVARRAI